MAKGGRPFFEGIGWEIIEPDARRPSRLYDGVNAMTGPLDAIAAQIEAILAPLRASGKLADEMLSFAIWRPASEVKRHV